MPSVRVAARWHAPALVPLTLGLLLWGAHLGSRPLSDNSFFTHLATGRLILDGGVVPRADPYSYTAAGAEWVVQSWLASVIYASAERVAGASGLVVLHVMLVALLACLVVALTSPADELIPRIVICALGMAVGVGSWAERPLLFGLLFFGLTLLVLERELDPRSLVVVFALWANVHGSFPLGLILVVSFAVGATLDHMPARHAARCLAWACGGLVIGVVNPVGWHLLTFPVTLLSNGEVLEGVVEWRAPTFESWSQRAWLAQLALFLVLLVRRPSYRSAIPVAVFATAGLLAMRNIPLASLMMLPAMARAASGVGDISVRSRSMTASVVTALLVCLGTGMAVAAQDEERFDLDAYPVAPLALARQLLDEDARIVAPDLVGNYRTLAVGPGAGVFYDDRFDMYPAELAAEHRTLHSAGPGWDQVLERRADAVIWPKDSPLAELLMVSPDWHVAAADTEWLLALRSSSG